MLERFDTAIRYAEWPEKNDPCPHSQAALDGTPIPPETLTYSGERVHDIHYISTRLQNYLKDLEAALPHLQESYPTADERVRHAGKKFQEYVAGNEHHLNSNAVVWGEMTPKLYTTRWQFMGAFEAGINAATYLYSYMLKTLGNQVSPDEAEQIANATKDICQKLMRLKMQAAEDVETVLLFEKEPWPKFESTSSGLDITHDVAGGIQKVMQSNSNIKHFLSPMYCRAFHLPFVPDYINLLRQVALGKTNS